MDYIIYKQRLFEYVLSKTTRFKTVEEIENRITDLNLDWLVHDLFSTHEYFAIDCDVLLAEL